MREIKVKAVYYKQMVSVNSFTLEELASPYEHEWEFSDGGSLPANDVERGDLDYLLYTSLKDKYGVEIYEGDIVQAENISRWQVYYWVDGGQWTLKFKDEDLEGGIGLYAASIKEHQLEVIGNIYENPELLEEKHEASS